MCFYGNFLDRPRGLVRRRSIYGKFCEKVFGPDDRETPAYSKQDGVDYVPMRDGRTAHQPAEYRRHRPHHRTHSGHPVRPIAFITIPIGNVIGGAMHDYFSGMICLRDGGTQMPDMVRKYSNKGVFTVYQIFLSVLLLLVGAVFIYTPGDIAATQVFGFSGAVNDPTTWIIYGVIFVYYLIATVFPIDAIIGRIYPIFGAILLFSAVGVFIGLFVKGYPLLNCGMTGMASRSTRGLLMQPPVSRRPSAMVSTLTPTTSSPSSSSPWPAAFSPASTPRRPLSSPAP